MSKRRNETNRAAVQLGRNRYKLGKRKSPGLEESGKELSYRYNPVTKQYELYGGGRR